MQDLEPQRSDAKEILILGGGFGGVTAAMELEKNLALEIQSGQVRITLVARDNFFLFTPLLHEVAASDLDPSNIVNPIHKLLRTTQFFCGEIEEVDLENKRVRVSHGVSNTAHHHEHELPFDHLVLCPGSVAGFGKTPGVEERALSMRTLGDAIALRGRLIESLEVANADCFALLRVPLLTFVVAGGGFAGVETAGAINDFLRGALKQYPLLDPSQVRVVLVHSGEVLLPELGPKLGAYAGEKLTQSGIEVRLKTRVTGEEDDCISLSDNTRIASHTLVWTVGNAPHPLLQDLPCNTEKGRVCVNEQLEVPDYPGVWSLGDAAFIFDEATGTPYPATAQHALREGKVVAHNIAASLRGDRKIPFRFKTLGQLAAIGHRRGVANVFGLQFSGFFAWVMWRTIYLSKLPRFEKKLRVGLDWALDLVFSKDLVQLSTPSGASIGRGDKATPERELAAAR